MKLMKRAQVYQCSNYNCTFNPNTIEAYSYKWWRFVALVEGKVIFNNYRYSSSTGNHQRKVRRLMEELGIKIDIVMPLPRGIRHDQTLKEMIVESEEHLCEKILSEELKKEKRNEKATLRRRMKKLEDYLENSVAFRDYDIVEAKHFANPRSPIASKVAVHQIVDMNSMERDVENAIYNFQRDGFESIVFYVGGE